MNKTALQQLIEWGDQMISDDPAKTLSFYKAIDKAEELLEVEKEQIVDAYVECYMNHVGNGESILREANSVYTKTYGGDK
jgi:hypothetical protein